MNRTALRRPAAMLGVLATAAVALLAGAPAASAASGMEVAVQDDRVFLHGAYYDRERALQHARDLQASWLRVNMLWKNTLPPSQARRRSRPGTVTYDWSKFDHIVDRAAAHGIKVHLTITGDAPAWATGNRRIGNYKPKASLFGRFARDVANHFRGRVSRYSVWNEPNWFTWLAPQRSAATQYRALYRAAWAGIKGADPGAQVLIGELAPYAQKGRAVAPLKFLRDVACVDGRYKRRGCPTLQANGFAHHPYEFTKSPRTKIRGADNATIGTLGRLFAALSKLERSRALVNQAGGQLGVYLTEFGYFSSPLVRGMPRERKKSDSTRASWTKQGFDIALRSPRVRQMLYYILINPPRRDPSRFFDLGIITLSGKLRQPYIALRSWAQSAANRGKIVRPGAPPGDGNSGSGAPPPSGESPPPTGGSPPPPPPPSPCNPLPVCP